MLGVLCTALAFVVMTVLIREAGTGRAMVITYVNPVIAWPSAWSSSGERPGAGAVVGLLLILAGSWLSTGGRLPAAARRRRGCAVVPADGAPLNGRELAHRPGYRSAGYRETAVILSMARKKDRSRSTNKALQPKRG